MKLAEALSDRSSIQKDLAWIKDQFSKIARVPEGAKPAEDPEMMLARMEARVTEFESLLKRINLTNLKVVDARGRTMTELLAERDACRARLSVLNQAYQESTEKQDVYGRQEIRYVPTMNVVTLRKSIETANGHLRTLNTTIQRLNWEADLIET